MPAPLERTDDVGDATGDNEGVEHQTRSCDLDDNRRDGHESDQPTAVTDWRAIEAPAVVVMRPTPCRRRRRRGGSCRR